MALSDFIVTLKLTCRKATLTDNAGMANAFLTPEEVGFMLKAFWE